MAVNTCDPALRSWVKSAHAPGTDFPIQNLPYGVGRVRGPGTTDAGADVMVAIGDQALSLRRLAATAALDGLDDSVKQACREMTLNALMGLSREQLRMLRERISALLEEARVETMPHRAAVEAALVPQGSVLPMLPAAIGDYTDFYASIFHATNVGKLFRPDNPLLPNYKYIPIGYHGRASSLVPAGTPVRRPSGQTRDGDAEPRFGPTKALDYE